MRMPAPRRRHRPLNYCHERDENLLCYPSCHRKLAPITPVSFPFCCKTQHQKNRKIGSLAPTLWNWVLFLIDIGSFQAYRMQPMCFEET
jgi:hypothetical protein